MDPLAQAAAFAVGADVGTHQVGGAPEGVRVVAGQCGFADLFHLSHRFTLRYGMSPSAYRATHGPRPSASDHAGIRRLANALWG